MADRNAIIYPDSLSRRPRARAYAVTGVVEVESAPATNVLTDEPSETFTVPSRSPAHSVVDVVLAAVADVSAVALVGLTPGIGAYYRVAIRDTADDYILGQGATPFVTESLFPTSLVSSANAIGTYTAVDEAITGGESDYMGPSNTDNPWNGHFGFATPAAPPLTGLGKNVFGVRVASFYNGTFVPSENIENATVTLQAYESGAPIGQAVTREVVHVPGANTAQVILLPWDAADLVTATGANVELLVTCSPGRPPSGLAGEAKYLRLYAVEWFIEEAAVPDVVHDSGWLPYSSGTVWHEVTPVFSGRTVRIGIIDDGSLSEYSRSAAVPDESIDIGMVFVAEDGSEWTASGTNYSSSFSASPRLPELTLGLGGQAFGSRAAVARELSVPWEGLTEEEGFELFAAIAAAGARRPMLLVLSPDTPSAAARRETTLLVDVLGLELGVDRAVTRLAVEGLRLRERL